MTDTALKNQILYQYHLGRWNTASQLAHPGEVFSSMSNQDFGLLVDNGIQWIYLLGIFDNSGPIIVNEESGQDVSQMSHRQPSPFAITNHQSPLPTLGTIQEFKNLVSQLHKQNLRVIVDYVPNHTSTVHPWLKQHPDYYHYHEDHPIAEFSGDVYKLNYQNAELRVSMIQILEDIAAWEVDGVRCDMAHLVPLDFWSESISQIKRKYPRFVFIAEAYTDSQFDLSYIENLINNGFDAVYHEPLYRNLKQVFHHHQPLAFLTEHINFAIHQPYANNFLNYVANHDDSLIEETIPYFEALFALTLFLPGPYLIYNGTLNGLTQRLAHHFFDPLPKQWHETLNIPDHLHRILQFKRQYQPQITSITNQDNFTICQLNTNSGSHRLILNLTSEPLPFHLARAAGVLRHLNHSDSLLPGHAEIILAK